MVPSSGPLPSLKGSEVRPLRATSIYFEYAVCCKGTQGSAHTKGPCTTLRTRCPSNHILGSVGLRVVRFRGGRFRGLGV